MEFFFINSRFFEIDTSQIWLPGFYKKSRNAIGLAFFILFFICFPVTT